MKSERNMVGFDIPSAPPTTTVNNAGGQDDPPYTNTSYYHSNVNSNPTLPPPLLSAGGGARAGFEFRDGENGWTAFGLGNTHNTIAHIFQDDLNHSKPTPRIPSCPASRNAFDENIAASETQFDPLSSSDALVQGNSSNHNIGGSASFSYTSALGTSSSRSATTDSQFMARVSNPRLFTTGEGRVNSIDKRSIKSLIPSDPSASLDLVAAFSSINLSADSQMNEERQIRQEYQRANDNNLNDFHSHGDNTADFEHFQQQPVSRSNKGSYFTMGKGSGIAVDPNYYMKVDGLHERDKHGGANSPSHFHSIDSPGSVIPNYSLSAHNINPSVMAGQFGSGALPQLFESAASSAIGISGMDSRKLRGRVALQEKFNAMKSHSVSNDLLASQVDPMYLHYLSSTNYNASQLGALNDPSIDGPNSYMDMLALQKAYLGTLLSPPESECGQPYMGKSTGLNHSYYCNSDFGIGSAYGGNPLMNSLLTHSPVGSGSLLRHGERNMRMPSGMRNLGAGFMGNWPSESGGFMDQSFGSSLLDEFKSSKTKCFELSEIVGHVVEFSADQYGSRFIQQKLETAAIEEKNMVFNEIIPQALSLMTDVFGNYVIQKFFEHGTPSQVKELADKLTGHVLTLSLQMYGCRVIQKAIEVVDLDQQKKMVVELDGHVMRCVRDQNGNHVIQKCIECIPEDDIQYIISTFYDQIVTLSTHPYGCRVIQRVLEHCHDPKTQRIVMDEIMHSVTMLAQDQYGNYVVQHLMEHGKPHEKSAIISKLNGKIVQMSQQKFASNVIEKCLTFGDATERSKMVNEMLGSTDDEPLQVMMKDQFANYVVQKMLETCDDQQLEVILSQIKNHLNALKKYTYGKHIVARVEKLVAAGERRISLQASYYATMA